MTIPGQIGLAVALTIAASLACTQSPNGAVKEFGLLGTWADNCNAQPGPSNQHATFSVTSGGAVLLRNDFGPAYGDMVYRIVDAKRLGEFRLSLRQVLTTDGEVTLETVMLRANAKVRNLVFARPRRKAVRRGWGRADRQPRNRLDGAMRHEVGVPDPVRAGSRLSGTPGRFGDEPVGHELRHDRANGDHDHSALRPRATGRVLRPLCANPANIATDFRCRWLRAKTRVAATGALW